MGEKRYVICVYVRLTVDIFGYAMVCMGLGVGTQEDL